MMKCSIKIVSAHLVGRIYERVGRDRAEWTEEQELHMLALPTKGNYKNTVSMCFHNFKHVLPIILITSVIDCSIMTFMC